MPLDPIADLLPILVKSTLLAQAQINWSRLSKALYDKGVEDDLNHRALCATVLVETAHQLKPLKEFGAESYFKQNYWENEAVRRQLGNTVEADAAAYCGRGFIQLTGRHNYEACAKALNLPLMSQPELLHTPMISARACVWFWMSHGLPDLVKAVNRYTDQPNRDGAWRQVRRRINGGTNGLENFLHDLSILQVR